jgi:hypothetical protein
MAARLVSFSAPQAEPSNGIPLPASPGVLEQAPVREHTWHGASGRRYLATVYSLIACPPLPKACFVLVRRDASGARRALLVGVGRDDAPTVNLARIRRRGAQLGANEVHVYFPAATDAARSLVACDLRAALFGALEPEPLHAAA